MSSARSHRRFPAGRPAAAAVRHPQAFLHHRLDRWFAAQVQRSIADGPVRLELWDGQPAPGAPPHAVGDLVVARPPRAAGAGFQSRISISVRRTRRAASTSAEHSHRGRHRAVAKQRPATHRDGSARRTSWRAPTTTAAARRNVHHHYDLGNDFYRLWLDREMVYTCAYFPTPDCRSRRRSVAKMDLVCRKLRLRPGERVIEAGCGWGALALHMARHYGVTVRPSTSRPNRLPTRASARGGKASTTASSSSRTTIATCAGNCDVFVSVGMLEHVGPADFPTLGEVIRPHAEARRRPRPAAFHRP